MGGTGHAAGAGILLPAGIQRRFHQAAHQCNNVVIGNGRYIRQGNIRCQLHIAEQCLAGIKGYNGVQLCIACRSDRRCQLTSHGIQTVTQLFKICVVQIIFHGHNLQKQFFVAVLCIRHALIQTAQIVLCSIALGRGSHNGSSRFGSGGSFLFPEQCNHLGFGQNNSQYGSNSSQNQSDAHGNDQCGRTTEKHHVAKDGAGGGHDKQQLPDRCI